MEKLKDLVSQIVHKMGKVKLKMKLGKKKNSFCGWKTWISLKYISYAIARKIWI